MKTKYKYIHFSQSEFSGDVWICKDAIRTPLAWVYYYKDWTQYVANFAKNAVFSADCLADIQDFLNQLNKDD